jgi:hypothetical protein
MLVIAYLNLLKLLFVRLPLLGNPAIIQRVIHLINILFFNEIVILVALIFINLPTGLLPCMS